MHLRFLFEDGYERASGECYMHRLDQLNLATGLDDCFDSSHLDETI
ncbi:MAG: hypothetical protein ACLQU4_13265 [Limisphaerales bacterium]